MHKPYHLSTFHRIYPPELQKFPVRGWACVRERNYMYLCEWCILSTLSYLSVSFVECPVAFVSRVRRCQHSKTVSLCACEIESERCRVRFMWCGWCQSPKISLLLYKLCGLCVFICATAANVRAWERESSPSQKPSHHHKFLRYCKSFFLFLVVVPQPVGLGMYVCASCVFMSVYGLVCVFACIWTSDKGSE